MRANIFSKIHRVFPLKPIAICWISANHPGCNRHHQKRHDSSRVCNSKQDLYLPRLHPGLESRSTISSLKLNILHPNKGGLAVSEAKIVLPNHHFSGGAFAVSFRECIFLDGFICFMLSRKKIKTLPAYFQVMEMSLSISARKKPAVVWNCPGRSRRETNTPRRQRSCSELSGQLRDGAGKPPPNLELRIIPGRTWIP